MDQEPRCDLNGSSGQGLTGRNERAGRTAFSSGGLTGEESAFELIQAVGVIHFLESDG